jgi:hypothetical protein
MGEASCSRQQREISIIKRLLLITLATVVLIAGGVSLYSTFKNPALKTLMPNCLYSPWVDLKVADYILVRLKTVIFEKVDIFNTAPSPESDEAWNSLMPG